MKNQFNFLSVIRLGFKSFITVPELSDIFPELDYVDHNRRLELNVRT